MKLMFPVMLLRDSACVLSGGVWVRGRGWRDAEVDGSHRTAGADAAPAQVVVYEALGGERCQLRDEGFDHSHSFLP